MYTHLGIARHRVNSSCYDETPYSTKTLTVLELTHREQRTYLTAEDNADLPPMTSRIGRSCRRGKAWVLEVGDWVLEVGYGADTKYEELWQTKPEQHQMLKSFLTHFGYEVPLRPLPLGVASTMCNTNLTLLVDTTFDKSCMPRAVQQAS